jgi:hypothetical protein
VNAAPPSLRATPPLAMPRCLAIFMPQASFSCLHWPRCAGNIDAARSPNCHRAVFGATRAALKSRKRYWTFAAEGTELLHTLPFGPRGA